MKFVTYDDNYNIALGGSGVVLSSASGSNSGYAGGDTTGPPGEISVVGLGGTVALSSNLATGVSLGDVLTIIQVSPAVAQFATSSNTGSVGSNAVTRTLGGQETVVAHGSMGATETFDIAGGNYHSGVFTADATFTFTGAPAGVLASWTLELTEDGTGGWQPTWPGSVVWIGGTTPTHDDTAGTTTLYGFISTDGGTTWIGYQAGGGGSGGTPATTVTDETTWGITPAVGTDTEYARQDHTHGSPAAPVGVGPLLITDTPAGSPLVFADILQNEAGTDLLYADA